MSGVFRTTIGVAFLLSTPAVRAAPIDPPGAEGMPVSAREAVTETTAEIMARHMRMSVTAPQKTLDFFIGRADTSRKKVSPDAESRPQGPAAGPQSPQISSGGGPLLPQTIGVNADGPGSGSVPCGTPPDTMGAVGPTQFISFVNCNLVSYNKATGAADGVLATTPDNFFNSVRNSSVVSDSHIRYDRISQRWFLVIINTAFPNNRVLLAVSNTATITPSTVWSFFSFPSGIGTHTSCFADYPVPGVDANAVYIGVNQFCGASLATANYAGSDIFVVQKSSVLGGGPIRVTGFASSGFAYPWTPHGVDNSDPSATEGYLIGVSNFSWSELDLIRVFSPGSTSPTLSSPVAIATANQGSPIPQPHLGNTGGPNGMIDAIDNRLLAATYRDGSLWTAMGVGVTVSGGTCAGVAAGTADRDAVFWWELQGIPSGSTPSIRQAGIVCDTALLNPNFYSYGTIAPSGQGHAAAGFTMAGNNTHISGGTAGRLSGDTLGTLQSIDVYGPGAAVYNPTWDSGAGRGYRRWGDFSFTSLDPCNDMTLWTIQEYVPAANQYGTRFAELKGPGPATPASASPPSVAAGQASVSVVVTGTSSSGSGFYDTPSSMSGEPCRTRLSSAVSGVTVNSAAYGSPTQVTLDISTVGATAGAKNVTVTNPDSQTATGIGILTITSACTPPATPVVAAPAAVVAGSPNWTASVAAHAGSTYAWLITNGTITAGQGTSRITFTAGAAGIPLTLSVTETDSTGCASAPGTATLAVVPVASAARFHTVTPCRQLDTRGGSPLAAGGTLLVTLTGAPCAIPSGATSVSANITVTEQTAQGHLTIYPANASLPGVSSLEFKVGPSRANNAVLGLSSDGFGQVNVFNGSAGTVHVVLDVNGYFQ
ncbi:MAG: hypothetical protein ACHQM4_08240 [Thermoanaerobaculia bacterium]